jgi:hypothetical protein
MRVTLPHPSMPLTVWRANCNRYGSHIFFNVVSRSSALYLFTDPFVEVNYRVFTLFSVPDGVKCVTFALLLLFYIV